MICCEVRACVIFDVDRLEDNLNLMNAREEIESVSVLCEQVPTTPTTITPPTASVISASEGDTVLTMHSRTINNTVPTIASINSELDHSERWTLEKRAYRINKGSKTTVDERKTVRQR
jgi:hypothetical protein